MIASWQISAAREILGWSQGQLARRVGSTQPHISKIEKVEIASPGARLLADIESAFNRSGIFFTENGLERRDINSYTISGDDWWLKVIVDVEETLRDRKDRELIIICGSDALSSPPVVQKHRELRRSGVRYRQLVSDDDFYLMGELDEYRTIPSDHFQENVSLIYANKVAVCSEDNTKALIVRDHALSNSWKNLFELLWKSLPAPKRSISDEKY